MNEEKEWDVLDVEELLTAISCEKSAHRKTPLRNYAIANSSSLLRLTALEWSNTHNYVKMTIIWNIHANTVGHVLHERKQLRLKWMCRSILELLSVSSILIKQQQKKNITHYL